MVSNEVARTIVGIIGNVISFALFAFPLPTFIKICKAKSVQEFRPDPYLATVLNCTLWAYYGSPLVQTNRILVLTINALGMVLELIFLSIYFTFAPWPKRKKIIILFSAEAIFTAVVIFTTMHFVPSKSERATIVGIICVIISIIMYFSPLTIVRLVIRTKSVKYMPFLLSLTNLINGLIWLCYALLKFDVNLVILNAVGAVSGAVQLTLYGMYYKTTDWEADKPGNKNSEPGNKNPDVNNV